MSFQILAPQNGQVTYKGTNVQLKPTERNVACVSLTQ